MSRGLGILILFVSLFVSLSGGLAKADCPVDANRVSLVLDLNAGVGEIDGAREAACANGQTVLVYPPMVQGIDAPQRLQAQASALYEEYRKCTTVECQKTKYAEYDAVSKKASELGSMLPQFKYPELLTLLTNLTDAGKSIENVVIIGHHTEGLFWGYRGNLQEETLIQYLRAMGRLRPAVVSRLGTVALLGCYGSTPFSVRKWIEQLPQIRVVFGYTQRAPASFQPAAKKFLADALIHADSIADSTSSTRVRSQILALRGMTYLLPGFYVSASNGKRYYFGKFLADEQGAITTEFSDFDEQLACNRASVISELKEAERILKQSYENGFGISSDTSSGQLRYAYSATRQYSGCIDPNSILNPDKVALLLFFQSVQKNFADVFAKTIAAARTASADAIQLLRMLRLENPHSVSRMLGDFLGVRPFPPANRGIVQSALEKLEEGSDILVSDFKTMGRTNAVKLSRLMADAANQLRGYVPQASRTFLPLTNFSIAMKTYLEELNPQCMEFSEWHEYREGVLPRAICSPQIAR